MNELYELGLPAGADHLERLYAAQPPIEYAPEHGLDIVPLHASEPVEASLTDSVPIVAGVHRRQRMAASGVIAASTGEGPAPDTPDVPHSDHAPAAPDAPEAEVGGSGGDVPPHNPDAPPAPDDEPGDRPGSLSLQQFDNEEVAMPQPREINRRFQAGIDDTLASNARYTDHITVGPIDVERVILECHSPHGETAFITVNSWGTIDLSLVDPSGNKTTHQYFTDEKGTVRREDTTPEASMANLPKMGEVPTASYWEIGAEQLAAERAAQEGEPVIQYAIGPAQLEHVLGMVERGQPVVIPLDQLLALAENRVASPLTPELGDSIEAGQEFIDVVRGHMRDKGVDPETSRPAIIQTFADGEGYFIQVEAGEVPGESGGKTFFVQTMFNLDVTPQTRGMVERATGHTIDIESGIFSGTLGYVVEREGETLTCTREIVVTDLAGNVVGQAPFASATADQVEVWRVRNFLREPAAW